MHRRRVLALFGTAAAAGCIGGGPGGESTATTEAEPPSLGVPDPEGCPPFDSRVERVVCSPEADDAPMALAPAEQSGALPREEFAFELANETDVRFNVNFYAWRIHKLVDGEWFRVAPAVTPQPLHRLPPGDTHTWTVTVDNRDLDRPIHGVEATREVTVLGLGAGSYAFAVAGWFDGDDYERNTGFAARFELEGEPLALTRAGVDSVERDGDTVVVRMPAHDTARTVEVTRTEESPADAQRVVTEQALRHTALRNALASFEEGVETVRVENAPNSASAVVYVDGATRVEYDGETYRVEEIEN